MVPQNAREHALTIPRGTWSAQTLLAGILFRDKAEFLRGTTELEDARQLQAVPTFFSIRRGTWPYFLRFLAGGASVNSVVHALPIPDQGFVRLFLLPCAVGECF